MKQTRARYKRGTVRLQKRASGLHVWTWRIPGKTATGKKCKLRIQLGTIKQFRTQSDAETERDRRMAEGNHSLPSNAAVFGEVINRFQREEMPPAISTTNSYQSLLKTHLRPKWGSMPIAAIKPFDVQLWLKGLKNIETGRDLASKTKGNLKGLMNRLFECAMLWGDLPVGRNPIELVHIRGVSKRQKTPRVLSSEEVWAIFNELEDPWRVMAIGQFCFGLRRSEIMALKWSDFDWMEGTVHISRRVISREVEETTKSEASNDYVPLHLNVALVFRAWREKTEFKGDNDYVFASPFFAGTKPYHPNSYHQKHFSPAAKSCGIIGLGTHSLRHTYRAWLDETGATLGVQQKLMRHSDISTTMKYGAAMSKPRREANDQIVGKVLTKDRVFNA
ncbi:MAG: site-specific recombinase, phage integrase family [Acidobacteriales bacterium]|nr:site-specific recombinase, phage integrase family [Terriglobales bacterium]